MSDEMPTLEKMDVEAEASDPMEVPPNLLGDEVPEPQLVEAGAIPLQVEVVQGTEMDVVVKEVPNPNYLADIDMSLVKMEVFEEEETTDLEDVEVIGQINLDETETIEGSIQVEEKGSENVAGAAAASTAEETIAQYLLPDGTFNLIPDQGPIRTLPKVVKIDENGDKKGEPVPVGMSTFENLFEHLKLIRPQFGVDRAPPFPQYRLEWVLMDLTNSLRYKTTDSKLWGLVGRHVTHLTLEGVRFFTDDLGLGLGAVQRKKSEQALMVWLMKNMVNLKVLVVKNCYLNGLPMKHPTYENDFLKMKLRSLGSLTIDNFVYWSLDNFPNLQHLSVASAGVFRRLVQRKDYNMAWASIPVMYPKLRSLELIVHEYAVFKDDDFASYRKVKFPALERLSVSFNKMQLPEKPDNYVELLEVLLENHREHLQVLELLCWPSANPYTKFPFGFEMNHLTELRLWGNVVKDLSFLKWTPKLKLLQWDLYWLEKQELFEDWHARKVKMNRPEKQLQRPLPIILDVTESAVENMKGIKLLDLEFLQINCNLSLEGLKTLGEWMPNLKTLKMVLFGGHVPTIVEQWPMLETLVGLHGSMIVDGDVSGKPAGIGLVNLPALKCFHLQAACNEGLLTDAAVKSGFLKMEALKDLHICVSPKFTVLGAGTLNYHFREIIKGNIKIIRNYSGNEDHKDWECCKATSFMQFLTATDNKQGSGQVVEESIDASKDKVANAEESSGESSDESSDDTSSDDDGSGSSETSSNSDTSDSNTFESEEEDECND